MNFSLGLSLDFGSTAIQSEFIGVATPPLGTSFLLDDNGNYVLDDNGNRIIAT